MTMINFTINALENYCKNNSGSPETWHGRAGTYKWSLGKVTRNGILNGVVRKVAAQDVQGSQIWVVAGSFKIDPSGKILRFTGISRKDQITIEGIAAITAKATSIVNDTVEA